MIALFAAPALVTTALAAPTQAAMESASWASVTTASNDAAGKIEILKTTVDGIECYRGAATTDVPPPKLLAVVADVEGATRWSSAGITEAKLLSKSGNEIAYYQYLDVPGWTMASDRFWFLKSTLSSSETSASLVWSPLSAGGGFTDVYQKVKTDHPDAVEPTVNVGSWRFEGATPNVKVTYSICTQPGGSIPVAIQNAATKRTLPDTVGDVIREARAR
ncbi:MAG: hypothetical protein ABMB14_02750 [Myxococcota bacterium]